MAYAITQSCCNDATCVSVCPVNCIHPTPDDPDFGRTDMLYIDPRTCIDCGACADACPVDAIFPVDLLGTSNFQYAEINRQHFENAGTDPNWDAPTFPRPIPAGVGPLRVAIVGTGPAASYAAQDLLRHGDIELTMIDRIPLPGGLIRYGVAPDHPSTKKIGDTFGHIYQHPRVAVHTNVEVGADIEHADLAAHHHAVIYAVGAKTDRSLGIPGEDLPGSMPATDLVGWYNAHPDVPAAAVALTAERAVVVGTGNVALDVARVLLSDPAELAGTDIADHALEALRGSTIREVVLLGRRGPEHAAYTRPELVALLRMPGVELVVDNQPGVREAITTAPAGSKAALLRDAAIRSMDWPESPAPGRRIVLRFHTSPTEFTGSDRVDGVRVGSTAGSEITELIPTGLAIRSIGYRGTPVPGLPFDEHTGTMPNTAGRVVDGIYVVGWIKRGPSGGIGTNRSCAAETVRSLLDDAAAGRLARPAHSAKDFARLVRRRKPESLRRKDILAIDRAERRRGAESSRPRVKFATVTDLLGARERFTKR
ncbi:MAG TPA: FAD-dependent oxidoreductase [Pseudonocardiaceae bacterium]|jgi:ferredoxin--NADP+ reductase|nr:FAD-dependent oxidoreductase [Pseudonocardiaceae bacterium]